MKLSILIPNFNNGPESAKDGRTDLIDGLCQSLYDTLADDPTPLEILAYDDGSTDSSLETLRRWSRKTWRGGEPFLELTEAEHHGVLARTSNLMVRRTRGDILVRLDGDTVMLTPNWAAQIVRCFDDGPPDLGVVGPKQLNRDYRIHAFGDWLLHPKGYHHVGQGLGRYAFTRPLEVDHVMGCFYCFKRAVFDDLDGFDEDYLRGQTIDFGMRARLKGWRCFAVPHVEFVHRHHDRLNRSTSADTNEAIEASVDTFTRKWGFSRLAPDLDEVRQRYRGTPLLWNARVFGMPLDPSAAQPASPATMDDSEWGRLSRDAAFQQAVQHRVTVVGQAITQARHAGRVVILGNGAGPLTHILATQGLTVTGVDTCPQRIELARQIAGSQQYPAGQPTFELQTDPRRCGLPDGCADWVLLFDQIEVHPNPVGLLKEAKRLLEPGRLLLVLTCPHPPRGIATSDPDHPYLQYELISQVQFVGGFTSLTEPSKVDPSRPLVVVARKNPPRAADREGDAGKDAVSHAA